MAEAQFDLRVVALFTLAFALIFVGAALFLRRHHHNDGHIHFANNLPLAGAPELVNSECPNCNCTSIKESTTPIASHPTTETTKLVSELCLQCLCEGLTGCKPVNCSRSGLPCGIFRIGKPYWIDAGKPILLGANRSTEDGDYQQCVNNPYCSGRAVENYMRRYKYDCNRDGILDCRDFGALHVLGPSGCKTSPLLPSFTDRFNACLLRFN